MVFRRDSLLGVPGLVQCVRRGTVAVANTIGSQLADDRALLPLAGQIIRFYLGESPLLPSMPTLWLGDLDQRHHVLDRLDEFDVRPLYGEKILHHEDSSREDVKKMRQLLLDDPQSYVAQPREAGALTVCLDRRGGLVDRRQDHILFGARSGAGKFELFPGALTRVSAEESGFTASELGGGSKDTWVLGAVAETAEWTTGAKTKMYQPPVPRVTSRVADAFYWLGRYLERARALASMVGVVEALETEELNSAERQLYRPVWNKMLPPLERTESGRKRSITTAVERYHLVLDGREDG
jgi:hypothetical protein